MAYVYGLKGSFRIEVNNLGEAIQRRHLNAVKHFLSKNKELINKLDVEGYTPLARAVKQGSLNIVQYLVSQDADVCKVGRNGNTPLAIAVKTQNLEIITFLLENGAEHTVQSAFLTAIEVENLEIVTMLKEKGALINYTYSNGLTPLTKSLENQDPTVTKYLIDNGANVDIIINDCKNRYLMKCVEGQNPDMVKLLHETGCNLDRPGECGYTPLTKATELDSFRIVQCLIEHGANINTFDVNKKTALAIAASNCSFRIARYLIDSGADVLLAKAEVEDYRSWNDDFARYMGSLKLKPKTEETGHEEDAE